MTKLQEVSQNVTSHSGDKSSEAISFFDLIEDKRTWVMLALGFSAGIPILLIFSTLSIWLTEAGVQRSAVTFFAWAALGYSFKFIWAPLVDKLPLPFLSKALGRRRGWLLLSQLMVITSIIAMASVNPQVNDLALQSMAIAAVALGFSSATQDIVIDAYRIECAEENHQAMLSAQYVMGYRLGMIIAGGGSLLLADYLGTSKEAYSYSAWQMTYWAMAFFMVIGVMTTLLISEPKRLQQQTNVAYPYANKDYIQFLMMFVIAVLAFIGVYHLFPTQEESGFLVHVHSFVFKSIEFVLALSAFCVVLLTFWKQRVVNQSLVQEGYWMPLKDFFVRYKTLAVWILLLIGFYKTSDMVMGTIANVFYENMGYTKTEIGSISKIFGVIVTISGGFAGAYLTVKVGVFRLLLVGAVLASASNLLFMLLSTSEPSTLGLILVISADNLSGGIATVAFVGYLSQLTKISFTAVQYALFSSLMVLFPKFFSGFSGTLVEIMGYNHFFLLTALMGIPVIALILFLQKKLKD